MNLSKGNTLFAYVNSPRVTKTPYNRVMDTPLQGINYSPQKI